MKLVTLLLLPGALLQACGPRNAPASTSVEQRHEYHDYDATIREISGGYSMSRLDGQPAWSMSLKTYPGSIENIDSVSVTAGTILVYSLNSYVLDDTIRRAAWFSLTPKQQVEKQFVDYRAFKQYLAEQKLPSNLHKMVQ
jgi:hypothetical protein